MKYIINGQVATKEKDVYDNQLMGPIPGADLENVLAGLRKCKDFVGAEIYRLRRRISVLVDHDGPQAGQRGLDSVYGSMSDVRDEDDRDSPRPRQGLVAFWNGPQRREYMGQPGGQ